MQDSKTANLDGRYLQNRSIYCRIAISRSVKELPHFTAPAQRRIFLE
jgi:hypothetical protein